jgi:hypothetical protein
MAFRPWKMNSDHWGLQPKCDTFWVKLNNYPKTLNMSFMKSFFITVSVGLFISSFYRVLFYHEPINDHYNKLFIALGSGIAVYLTYLIERKKNRQSSK